LPVLALIMAQFPFVITGFHSDNGSEYINHHVAKPAREAAHRADQVTLAAQ
jgi:transposase InsO family protein